MYSSSVFKKFNWVSTPSAYQSAESWKEKRSTMVSDFQSAASTLADSFTTAITDQVTGMGDLAARAAMARIQDEAKGTTSSASSATFDFSV